MGLFSGLTSSLGGLFQDPWAESNIGDVGNRLTGVYGQMDKTHIQGMQSALQSQAYNTRMFNNQVALANSAHQREVADLRAAGLNPILSATGGTGAMTPGASAGAMASAGAGSDNSFMQTARSILNLQKGDLKASVKEKEAIAKTEEHKQKLLDAQTDNITAQYDEIASAAELNALNNKYESILRKYLYNDKDYVGRDAGMRKLNLLLPSALQTVQTASGIVNSAAAIGRVQAIKGLADKRSPLHTLTENYNSRGRMTGRTVYFYDD